MTISLPGLPRGNDTRVLAATTAVLTPAAATRTYLLGVSVPVGGLKVGARIRFALNMTKTAAGTATSTFDLAFGTAGTTADTARLSFTKPAGTAAADDGMVVIEAVVKAVSATVGVVVGTFTLVHNLAATGHAQIPCVVVPITSGNFDNSSESLKIGLCLTTGAADAITITQVTAELVQ